MTCEVLWGHEVGQTMVGWSLRVQGGLAIKYLEQLEFNH